MFEEFNFDWKIVVLPVAAFLYFQLLIYIDREYLRKKPLTTEEYLGWLARLSERSEYDLFFVSAEDWNVPDHQVERDFTNYLKHESIPYYVEDFVRRARKELKP